MSSGYERYINNVIIIIIIINIIIIIIRRTPLKEGQRHLWNRQQTIEKCFIQWKTPKRNGNVIAKFLLFCSLAPVQGVYTVTLLDHEAVNVWSVWLYNEKMIPLFCYNVPVLDVLYKLN